MKNVLLVMLIIFFSSAADAQSWKKTIYGTGNNRGVRTITLKPSFSVTVRSLMINNDSLSYSTAFSGKFERATDDSLTIKLNNFSDLKVLGTGVKYSTTIPGSMYVQPFSADTGMATFALSDIDFIMYRNARLYKVGEMGEGMVFASLFVILLSPFVCIDYSEGTFNADRYKYWALGSTAALFGTLTFEILFTGQKKVQFKADWPFKKQKEWSFSQGE